MEDCIMIRRWSQTEDIKILKSMVQKTVHQNKRKKLIKDIRKDFCSLLNSELEVFFHTSTDFKYSACCFTLLICLHFSLSTS